MVSITINAPGDNACGMHAHKLRVKVGYNLLTALRESFNAPAYLYPSWLPGRQDIIYNKGYHTVADRITILSALAEVVTTNIDTIKLCIIAKTNGYHVWFTRRVHCSKSAQTLIVKIF